MGVVVPRTSTVQLNVTWNGPCPYSAAPAPITLLVTLREPILKVLVTVTPTGLLGAAPTTTWVGEIEVACA